MSIKHEHTLHPITALEFYRNQSGTLLVLAGEGSFLKVFEADTSRLLCQCEVFEGQTIHGIAIREDISRGDALQVAIWGGSSLTLLQKSDLHQLLDQDVGSIVGTSSSVSDWILDTAISPVDDGSCVLVTAHNTVLRARLEQPSGIAFLEELHSPSKSILYSAHLIWESPNCVLVAAGTVFGEIIVWQCSVPENAATSEGRVLFTFTGHEGSIFGVDISPPITHPDKSITRLLASCSDDRTVRIWDLSSGSIVNQQNDDEVSPRETGFGENGESTQNKCVAMAMGHASRIWRVKFLVGGARHLEPMSINVLSFGEDSTTQRWSLEFGLDSRTTGDKGGNSISPGTISSELVPGRCGKLSNMKVSAFHSGKHIWSAATRLVDGSRSALATGGADGKISLYNVDILGNVANHPASILLENMDNYTTTAKVTVDAARSIWELDKVLSTLAPSHHPAALSDRVPPEELIQETLNIAEGKTPKKKKVKKVAKDTFNRYAFVSEDKLLVTTTFGRVLLGHIHTVVTWEEILLPESGKDDLKSYAMVRGFPEAGVVYLAGGNGKIYAYHGESTLSEVGSVEGKVADMFQIFDPKTKCFELLVTTLAGSVATLFTVDEISRKSGFSAQRSYDLPERIVLTSAGKIGNLLVLGSRTGSIVIHDPGRQQSLFQWASDDALSGDAITAVIPLAASCSSEINDQCYFLTTSRKGVYSIFACSLTRNSTGTIMNAVVQPVHNGTPPFGPMVEGAWYSGEELILYGFKGKNFVVWNEARQCEITNVECGGAHRSYAYSPVRDGGHFIYTKASKLYLHSQLNPSHKIIKQGGHGREIKACAVSPDRTLMATGAEDTAIRIWTYKDGSSPLGNQLNCLAIIQRHTAGIQHLQWHGSKYLLSSGGNEEFFVWAVEQIPGPGIGVVCEATCPHQTEERDLRIMGFDVSELPSLITKDETTLLISLAYSDSTIRMYTYLRTKGFQLVATGRYTSSCLMQIRNIKLTGYDIYLLTAATDGNLTLWKGEISSSKSNRSQQLVMLSSGKVHQSSIKSLDITTTKSKGHVIVATGGDDNALTISVYFMRHLSELAATPKSFILKAAHSAAITGLCFISRAGTDGLIENFRVLSSSNDQRVKEWNVRVSSQAAENEFDVGIRKTGDVFTSVADVGDVAALRDGDWNEKKVLIVGNGMEVWNVSRK